MKYEEFFNALTDHEPFPWQEKLGTAEWPTLLDIPTGLGKTAGVVLAWLHMRSKNADTTARRLVYCLPTRALVEQTVASIDAWLDKADSLNVFAEESTPVCVPYLGGNVDRGWIGRPEQPTIIVGTQDLLISAALNRGYAISRFVWPMAFGLLHNDALWVFDETQLMGPALPNSAQIEGLRRKLGTVSTCRSLWMSATLRGGGIETYDHRAPNGGFTTLELSDDDRGHYEVSKRLNANKRLQLAKTTLEKPNDKKYAKSLAAEVLDAHIEGERTIVIVNTVDRAQAIYGELKKASEVPVLLLHSRFREAEKKTAFQRLSGESESIVVSTQVIEAGIDVSSRVMFTEAAPYSSIVQRVGRCNRRGNHPEADVFLVKVKAKDKSSQCLPYDAADIRAAQEGLKGIKDVGPQALRTLDISESSPVYSHLRQRDLERLFHNDADLLGDDIDISAWIRDSDDTDVSVYWREIPDVPDSETPTPERAELCRVSLHRFAKFVKQVSDRRKTWPSKNGLKPPSVWSWDFIDSRWRRIGRNDIVPGRRYLVTSHTGGYSSELGWTGDVSTSKNVTRVTQIELENMNETPTSQATDEESQIGRWVKLEDHLRHVGDAAENLGSSLKLDDELVNRLRTAGYWHDIGKAHPAFQDLLKNAYDSPPKYLVAKSPELRGHQRQRRYFRHELASAIAYLVQNDDADGLVAYLIMSHHGKIRTRIRSAPNEAAAPDGRRFARGVWEGDTLPEINIGDGSPIGETSLTLDLMSFGDASWTSATDELLSREDIGPFRLAYYEAVFRAADWRASAAEATQEGVDHE